LSHHAPKSFGCAFNRPYSPDAVPSVPASECPLKRNENGSESFAKNFAFSFGPRDLSRLPSNSRERIANPIYVSVEWISRRSKTYLSTQRRALREILAFYFLIYLGLNFSFVCIDNSVNSSSLEHSFDFNDVDISLNHTGIYIQRLMEQ